MVDVNVAPFEIEVRTRAGDVVRADVHLPGGDAEQSYPVLVAASPYQKALRHLPGVSTFPFLEYGPMQLYLDNGYAYVCMDVPGTGRSEGSWDPVSRVEGEAIHDLIEHVGVQPWSTGSVGMIGMSHYCWSQWNTARTRPPHLRTLGAYDGATDSYRDWMYHGGIPTQGFFASWLFGSVLYQHYLNSIDFHEGRKHEFIYDCLTHPFDDEWQRRRSPFWELDQVDIPVLSIGAWGKGPLHLRGNFYGYERVTGPKKLLITHPDSLGGAQALFFDEGFHRTELLPWYDHHHSHQQADPLEPGTVYQLRVELLPMSFLAREGDRIRLEISNHDSLIADAPMTHFYGQKVGTDTYHHDQSHPSNLRLHERPRR